MAARLGPPAGARIGSARESDPRRDGMNGVLAAETPSQQERLQAIAEKRRRQAEIENRRRQLEDDRRQLQHLKSKALRERWLLEGTPSSASEGDEDMRRQMQEDEQKARHLEESISRLEQEIEELENTDALPTAAARGSVAAPSPAPGPAPSPAPEDQRAEAVPNSQQVRGSGAPPCWPRSRSTHRLWGCGCGRPTSQMRAHPSPATSQLRRLHALLGLPGPQFPRQTGASRVFKESVKNKRFMGRGSSPKTTCLSSFLGSPTQWASPVYLHTALSGGAASPFDEKDFGPKRLRDWLKATQWSSLY
uniref:Paralemmin n=1 Tax=Ovis aries TaxID=9940 RepID=A0AC11DWG2_SHEEP